MTQLLGNVLAQPDTREAYEEVSKLIPDGVENPHYEVIHRLILGFATRIVEITSTAKLPGDSRSNPGPWSSAAIAFISQQKPTLELQAQVCRGELMHVGMPDDLPLEHLGEVVMRQTLQVMAR